jgi:hypothetical protein
VKQSTSETIDLSEFKNTSAKRFMLEVVRDKLDDTQQAKLDAALRNPEIPNSAIARVLGTWGHPINETTVRSYRMAKCR